MTPGAKRGGDVTGRIEFWRQEGAPHGHQAPPHGPPHDTLGRVNGHGGDGQGNGDGQIGQDGDEVWKGRPRSYSSESLASLASTTAVVGCDNPSPSSHAGSTQGGVLGGGMMGGGGGRGGGAWNQSQRQAPPPPGPAFKAATAVTAATAAGRMLSLASAGGWAPPLLGMASDIADRHRSLGREGAQHHRDHLKGKTQRKRTEKVCVCVFGEGIASAGASPVIYRLRHTPSTRVC